MIPKSPTIVKINWFYMQKLQTELSFFKIDKGNHQQMLKPIGFTCDNVKRSGHVFRTDTRSPQQSKKTIGSTSKNNKRSWYVFKPYGLGQPGPGRQASQARPARPVSQASLASKAIPGQAEQAGPSGRIPDSFQKVST